MRMNSELPHIIWDITDLGSHMPKVALTIPCLFLVYIYIHLNKLAVVLVSSLKYNGAVWSFLNFECALQMYLFFFIYVYLNYGEVLQDRFHTARLRQSCSCGALLPPSGQIIVLRLSLILVAAWCKTWLLIFISYQIVWKHLKINCVKVQRTSMKFPYMLMTDVYVHCHMWHGVVTKP